MEGRQRVGRYASRLQHVRALESTRSPKEPTSKEPTVGARRPARARKGLSFKEQKELEGIPSRIEANEKEQAELTERLSDPRTYKERPDQIAEIQARMEVLPAEIEALFARWSELSERAGS